MLSRKSLILSKYVLYQTISFCEKSCIHQNVRHKSIFYKLENKISWRSISWSKILCNEPSNDNKSDNANTKKDGSKKSKPVLEVISPKLKTTVKKESTVVLENVKEKSLQSESENVRILSADTIKKLKGKGEKEPEKEKAKPPPKKRKRVDLSVQSLERNFITPVKAMSDFLLKPSDLEALPKTKRRSPYESEPPITVYWRKDVEAKALEIWGTRENLQKEQLKRDIERKKYQQNIFTVKRRLRDFRREMGKSSDVIEDDGGLMSRSGKVVLTAVVINGANFLSKLCAWIWTGSHSMFSECIHSLADTINQLILAYGIHKSIQIADSYHPYGYSNMKYVASLISGVGIFCVGTGLSIYHGIAGLINPVPLEDFFWAYITLGGSFVSEGATCLVAFNSIRKGARQANMSVMDFIFRGQDPSVTVVLLEDFAAVIGVVLAAGCIGVSALTESTVPDAMGSLLVGCILGSVASFIIYTNVAALVGRSIPEESLEKINAELEKDIMIRAIHDVKGIDMGSYLVRYKAELDFDGRELTRSYLDKLDLNDLLDELKTIDNIDKIEEFMLKHGENIVDMMGGEIDRIEMKLRKKYPEIRHCDLEIL
ncbi:proton-coupled zinc antiporter SLC30A9, mitochondrial [Diorhabda carinulata]|uniref:proton-coupled zinc antiporter SLC30A9, mitochondrial n=1 Tax=Diorhabda carinulata TaxID=1163345 RepID=UPI0025A06760|nr:proton-coupled zinc antiporter SLC30A9, mitochondrial [Diorhabda carinulata]